MAASGVRAGVSGGARWQWQALSGNNGISNGVMKIAGSRKLKM